MGSGSSPGAMSTFNPQQVNLNRTLGPLLRSQVGQGVTPYNGQLVAPVYGADQIQNQLNNYNPNQFQSGQQTAISQALSGQPSYSVSNDPQQTANYFQQAVVNPSMLNYNQVTAPAINQAFAAQGGTFSTARGIAQKNALSNLQSQNAAGLATMQYQTQQQDQSLNAQLADSAANRQVQGIGLAQQYQNQPLYNAQALTAALAPFQNQAQNQDAANYSQWQSQQAYNNPYLQQIMALLGDQTQSAYQQPNYTGQYIGAGVSAAANIGSQFASSYAANASTQAASDAANAASNAGWQIAGNTAADAFSG